MLIGSLDGVTYRGRPAVYVIAVRRMSFVGLITYNSAKLISYRFADYIHAICVIETRVQLTSKIRQGFRL